VPERNADILQVLVSQMGEYGDVNFIFGKTLRVLPETKSLKPLGNLLHIASAVYRPLTQQDAQLILFASQMQAVSRIVAHVCGGSFASIVACPRHVR